MSALTEVGSFYDPEEAYCAWGYLKANGVYSVIQNEYHLTSAPWLRVALGGYRLLAPAEEKPVVEALFSNIGTTSNENDLKIGFKKAKTELDLVSGRISDRNTVHS